MYVVALFHEREQVYVRLVGSVVTMVPFLVSWSLML